MPFVYLVQNSTKFKIGYTKQSLKNRYRTYRTHDPDAQWVTEVETPDQKLESLLRTELKKTYLTVPPHYDWFYGSLPAGEFLSTVQKILENPIPDCAIEFSPTSFISTQVSDYFLNESICIEALILNSYEGGLDWVDHLKMIWVEEGNYLEMGVPTLTGKLIILFCAPPQCPISHLFPHLGFSVEDWIFQGELVQDLLSKTIMLFRF